MRNTVYSFAWKCSTTRKGHSRRIKYAASPLTTPISYGAFCTERRYSTLSLRDWALRRWHGDFIYSTKAESIKRETGYGAKRLKAKENALVDSALIFGKEKQCSLLHCNQLLQLVATVFTQTSTYCRQRFR